MTDHTALIQRLERWHPAHENERMPGQCVGCEAIRALAALVEERDRLRELLVMDDADFLTITGLVAERDAMAKVVADLAAGWRRRFGGHPLADELDAALDAVKERATPLLDKERTYLDRIDARSADHHDVEGPYKHTHEHGHPLDAVRTQEEKNLDILIGAMSK